MYKTSGINTEPFSQLPAKTHGSTKNYKPISHTHTQLNVSIGLVAQPLSQINMHIANKSLLDMDTFHMFTKAWRQSSPNCSLVCKTQTPEALLYCVSVCVSVCVCHCVYLFVWDCQESNVLLGKGRWRGGRLEAIRREYTNEHSTLRRESDGAISTVSTCVIKTIISAPCGDLSLMPEACSTTEDKVLLSYKLGLASGIHSNKMPYYSTG